MASGTRSVNSESHSSLLAANDPPPVGIVNPVGASSFLLIGDHAGNAVPERLGSLGLGEADLARHIGWDIGIMGLGTLLAEALDAPFVHQAYSRLVVDCNRDPGAKDAIAEISDATLVPGNAGLSEDARAERFSTIHEPYHVAIADMLAERDAARRDTILVALHSFTPRMNGMDRPWQAGVLHDRGDPAFARRVLAALRERPGLTVGDNQPYAMDSIDYTIPRHAYPAMRPYVELEVRQDLLASADDQAAWSVLLKEVLEAAR